MYGLLGCLLPNALKKKVEWEGEFSCTHTPPKVMESMTNFCWCGDCHSFEILDGILFLHLVSLGVNNFVNKCLCACFHLSFFFHLVNFVSGTLFLMKAHSHKVRRVIFQSTTNYYIKKKCRLFFSFLWVLKNFQQSPPWLSILSFLIKDKERKHMRS